MGSRATAVAVIAWMAALIAAAPVLAGTISGRITDRAALPLPGAVVIVADAATHASVSTTSDGDGRYSLDVPDGTCVLTVELSGFRTLERRGLVTGSAAVVIDLTLDLASFSDEVTVNSDSARPLLAEPEPNAPAIVTRPVIDNAMLPNSRYDDVLTLMPGVVRTPDGEISIAGTRPEESALFINGVNATDPVTGRSNLTVPIESVDAVQVHAGGYAADLGPATGGVTSVQTRSGTNQFRASADSLFPRLLFNDDLHGVEFWEPNLGASGALVKDRVFFEQGFGYRYDRNAFDTLAGPARDRVTAPASWTQIDAQVSGAQRLRGSVSMDAQHTDHAGITAFFPLSAAPGVGRSVWSGALSDRLTTGRTSTLELHGAIMRSTLSVTPLGAAPYEIGHDGASGRYFEESLRRGDRLDVGGSYLWMPAPSHAIKVGAEAGWLAMHEESASAPVTLLRGDGSPSRRIDFGAASLGRAHARETSAYISDTWTARHWLTLEVGARTDRHSGGGEPLVAPRIAWTLGRADAATSVSGSLGLFADKLVLGALTYDTLPSRTMTQFDDSGAPVDSVREPARVAPLEVPRAFRWDLALDRKLTPVWMAHLRYQEQRSNHELVIEPDTATIGETSLTLRSTGRSQSRALETTIGFRPRERADLFASYVRSSSRGSLNAFTAVDDLFREPFVQADQQGTLPGDVPHRVLVWGVITAPGSLSLAPFFEARSGFPYSVIDDNWRYVGPRNGARLPWATALDLSVTRVVDLPGRLPHARVGLKFYRLVSLNSEREIQRDVQSPSFGARYDGVPRDFALVCTFLGGRR